MKYVEEQQFTGAITARDKEMFARVLKGSEESERADRYVYP